MLNDKSLVDRDADLIKTLEDIEVNGPYDRGFFAKRKFFENIETYLKIQRHIEKKQ